MEKKEYKITVSKFFKHLHVVHVHRFNVFRLCLRCGIPFQGLVHDLSKYSPTEFWESVKYFQGNYSPLRECKNVNGYSEAWMHHKGRNKHHYEYWYDYDAPISSPVMPFKYYCELICDTLAAGMVYNGKDWKMDTQLKYWDKVKQRNGKYINPKMVELITKTYEDVAEFGIKKVVKKKYLRSLYNKYIGDENE